jgi:hypothetical protein
MLFRDLATLRTSPPAMDAVADLRWAGPRPEFVELCADVLDAPNLPSRAQHIAAGR